MITLALTAALATPAAQAAETSTTRAQATAELRHAQHVVRFFQTHSWLRAPRQPNCLSIPWTRTCRIARSVYMRERQKMSDLRRRLFYLLPAPNDWRTAALVAQRPYPGTFDWLMSCSSAEGGHGRWVPNNQGSGVGGWMQMYPSTFWSMYESALRNLRSRGFQAPAASASWYSPLGQALGAAWARWSGNDGHHWSASHGNGC